MEIIGAFLADASQIHGDVAVGTTIPYKLVATLVYPSLPELQFSFWRILSYNNEKECFVAVELESNFVSEEQALEIAKSIEF